MLLLHTLLSLAIAAVAMAILMRISSVHVPSWYKVTHNYSKFDTSSRGVPFVVMVTLMLFLLFTMILDFSVLTSVPYAMVLDAVHPSPLWHSFPQLRDDKKAYSDLTIIVCI